MIGSPLTVELLIALLVIGGVIGYVFGASVENGRCLKKHHHR